jgi:hypothetical protein
VRPKTALAEDALSSLAAAIVASAVAVASAAVGAVASAAVVVAAGVHVVAVAAVVGAAAAVGAVAVAAVAAEVSVGSVAAAAVASAVAAAPVGAVAIAAVAAQVPVLVLDVELPGRDPVLFFLAGVFLERRHHGILSATQPPGHDGAFYRNPGHNADLLGVRPNRDTVAGNFASNEGFADTTYATSAHTSYCVLQYRWEDTRNTGPIRIEVRKNYTANPVKTNHRCNRSTAY